MEQTWVQGCGVVLTGLRRILQFAFCFTSTTASGDRLPPGRHLSRLHPRVCARLAGRGVGLPPGRPFAAKLKNYECGAEPIGPAWVQFPVGFYLVALVFIVFDALAVFLFPWVLALRQLGVWGILAMVLFLAILALGWLYAYREGILEWK